jgi:predicted peptidase
MTSGFDPWVSLIVLVGLGAALAVAVPKSEARGHNSKQHATGFIDRTVEVDGTTRRYQVYVPFEWTKDKKWPVILFLHGAGERGTDGLMETEVGLGTAIRLHEERWPFIVVMPQCDPAKWWTDQFSEAVAMKALRDALHEFNGDEHRVYLTGISMGGYGTWDLASRYPKHFAAIAPICGGVRGGPTQAAEIAERIKNIPIWIFHGDADPTVPVSQSQKMNDALKAVGADVRYSEYPGVAHNSWDRAYAEPELPQWFLSHRTK